MTRVKRVGLAVLVIAVLVGIFYGYRQKTVVAPQAIETNALKEVIDQCSDITERAAAHLVAIVEFQKLEIIGRKARVFKMCLQDHGYIENGDWLMYSQPIAEKKAIENHISVNEALESLRRADMVVPIGEVERPVYWVKQQQEETPIPN